MKRDKIDAAFSKYVRLLEDGTCRVCHKKFGLTKGLQVHHFFSRGKLSVRYDRDNACSLCTYDHFKIQHNPLMNMELALSILGQEKFNELEKKANTPSVGKNKIDREAIYADLKEKIKLLEG